MKKRHDGDCTVYAALLNGFPTDGICTCGYAHQHLGCEPYEKYSELLYSDEKRATFPKRSCGSCGLEDGPVSFVIKGKGLDLKCDSCDKPFYKEKAKRKRRRRRK